MHAAAPDALPQDPESLRALLLESRSRIAVLEAAVQHRDTFIEKLKLQLARLQRMQYGQSSEKLAHEIAQLELLIEELETPSEAEQSAAVESQKVARVRRPLPESLPHEDIVHEAPCQCPACGGPLTPAGEDSSEMLEFVPQHWKVIRHVRPKQSCRACDRLFQAPAPSRPIARSFAGPGLLAHVIVSKYADHLPLHRQSEIYARDGIGLDTSTLADWVGGVSHLLAPLVERIGEHVFAAEKLHADDTPVPVLTPGLGKTKTGRLWTYVRDERPAGSETPPAVLFRYSPDRKGEHPRHHLATFRGTLQADAYAGFHHLYDAGIREAACWAHVRRKFFDLQEALKSEIAAQALQRIGALYDLEREIRGQLPDERRRQRQSRAGPLLDAFKSWLQDTLRKVSAKSELATAMRYALTRWPALTRYRDDGLLEIDNNIAERALRAVALGRKNYLFAGADSGGERAAAMYSLIGSAKLNGIDPEAWLRFVIDRIADHPVTQLDELLPWNFHPEPQEHSLAA